eukprot:GHVO01011199.1.p1 GENE.GHVO01011199.1~~GHVO01011199.1.p1  ORF type:complete len:312 (+),score=54.01 GHVO01011199.1:199-1134(+)
MDDVSGRDVYVIQSAPSPTVCADPHSNIIELLLLVSLLRRASAGRITAVLPYMSYFRQMHSCNSTYRRPLAAADMAKLLSASGVDRVVSVELHSARAESFFPHPIPMTNIQPHSLAIRYFKKKELENVVIISTENTGAMRAKAFWSRMRNAGFSATIGTTINNRPERANREGAPPAPSEGDDGQPSDDALVGEVNGLDCIIVDDIIDTAERACNTAKTLKDAGAKRIFLYSVHGLFSEGAINRLNNAPIDEILVTNSITLPPNVSCEKLRVLSIGKFLAETIRRIHNNLALSTLHRDEVFDHLIQGERFER